MEQHPVPQQISSYQFKLVGDMTLKQFFKIAAAALLALLIYSTNLYGIIKWPLIFFVVVVGIAFAFIPFRDRPLTAWVGSFFRAIYSPTKFAWKTYEKPAQHFLPEESAGQASTVKGTIPSRKKSPFLTNLEKAEEEFMSRISLVLKGKDVDQPTTSTEQPTVPTHQITQQVAPASHIPQNQNVKVTPPPPQIFQTQVVQQQASQGLGVSPMSAQDISTPAIPVQFSINAAPPMPTETPNTIVGQVMDPDGRIIEGAILEIMDDTGRPVRALKSNKLGHFIIVTELANGTYRLTTDKDGYKFDDLTFDTKGDIIPPIAVKARSKVKIEKEKVKGD